MTDKPQKIHHLWVITDFIIYDKLNSINLLKKKISGKFQLAYFKYICLNKK